MADPTSTLEAERSALLNTLATSGDMRRGSITECYRRCGKPTCACAMTGHPGHGPYYAFTRKVQGKTKTVQLRPGPLLTKIEREVETYRGFRATCDRLLDVNNPSRCSTGRAGGGKKTTLGAVLQAEVIAEIDTLIGTDAVDGWDFEAIETAARRQASVSRHAPSRGASTQTRPTTLDRHCRAGAGSQRTPVGTTRPSRVCWGR